MNYKIKFTLGDFSCDGHNQSDTYIVQSNKPVEEVREVQFSSIDLLGFDVGELCSDYGDRRIPDHILEIMQSNSILDKEEVDLFKEYDNEIQDPDELLGIWLATLMSVDPDLKLERILDDIPSLHFYGYDGKGRHLNVPGYGLYE